MTARLAVVVGAGQVACGHVAPMLRTAGWDTVLVSRDPALCGALSGAGRLWVEVAGRGAVEVTEGVRALPPGDPALPRLVAQADLLATSVGADSLRAVGRWLAPLVAVRLRLGAPPVNLVTFENHRTAPELLADGLIRGRPELAGEIGVRLGIAGSAVWRISSHRRVESDGVRLRVDAVADTYVDAASLVQGAAPTDGSLPGLELVCPFLERMTQKLWIFNAGHATAAYLGWLAGCHTVAEAMRVPRIHRQVAAVLFEARAAVLAGRGRRAEAGAPTIEECLARYLEPTLADPVTRVARHPRRKLSPGDRLIGPAVAVLQAGTIPSALACAAAAALHYAAPDDPQAVDLQAEIARDGPAEALATVSRLDPADELSKLICRAYQADFQRSCA